MPIGTDTLKEVLSTVRLPVVAIGGLNLDNLSEVRAMGAKNVAMVRAYQQHTGEVIQRVNRELAGQ